MHAREALTADAMTAFAVFSRHLNFTRAAEELHIAQPSLHAKVAKLSRALEAQLYEKGRATAPAHTSRRRLGSVRSRPATVSRRLPCFAGCPW